MPGDDESDGGSQRSSLGDADQVRVGERITEETLVRSAGDSQS